MRDNEKAATFIGWTGIFHCDGPINGERYCEEHNLHTAERNIPVPAHDMTRPEHYMKALEKLEFELMAVSRPKGMEYRLKLVGAKAVYSDVLGEAVVAALAGLYDAIHPSAGTPTDGAKVG